MKPAAALVASTLLLVTRSPEACGYEAEISPAARFAAKQLAAFAAGHETARPKRIVCVYFTPADRKPPAGHRERLTRVMTDIQEFFAGEMARHGLGGSTSHRRTVRYDLDDARQIRFHYVAGKHEAAYYLGRDFRKGYEIREESKPVLAAAGIDDAKETVVYFCHLRTEQDGKTSGIGPYYGSGAREGVFRDGRCWFTDASILDPRNLSDGKTMLDDEEYGKISVGRYNSIFIGGAAHELGHGLGLPHTKERPDEAERGTSLMGSGNRTYGEDRRGEGRGSFLVLADALRLAAHPIFSGTVRDLDKRPEAHWDELQIEAGGDGLRAPGLRITGRIVSAVPVYAVIAYHDPDGNSDYNATSWIAAIDDSGRFSVEVNQPPSAKGELRLVACHVNGATSVLRRSLPLEPSSASPKSP
ncbi:MAG: hypothetical protein JNK76_14095 [Planctomycetales bacterium]|nr:hypothetical protein [Planctomycetales bacterium]